MTGTALTPDMEDFLRQTEWNRKNPSVPLDRTIIDLFESQVRRTPDDCALVFKHDDGHELSWTYVELNDIANRMAQAIRKQYEMHCGLPLEPGTMIAIYLERSCYSIISLLGILKAGAAYVPLSPEYPRSRVQLILHDTQAALILTDSVFYDSVLETSSDLSQVIPVLNVEEDSWFKTPCPYDVPVINQSRDIAYVIYTSGSTGNPKGVMVEHASVINTLYSLRKVYDINLDCRKAICFSNIVFDVSVSEIFNTLCFGGELHVLNTALSTNYVKLSEYINDAEINFVFLPPSVLAIFPQGDYPSVEAFIFAGESCDQDLCAYWAANHCLYNYYGPTEASVYASGKQALGANLNEIGRPLENVNLYVLDDQLRPVPTGEVGELYIGGAGLARGYLNQPGLTAERFIVDPFSGENSATPASSRMYKTGDLVRWEPDSHGHPRDLAFIGRNDFQVNLRGLRIELTEIEVALKTYGGVNQAVVVAKQKAANPYLAAYVTFKLDGKTHPSPAHLKEVLASVLPKFMIPEVIIVLDELPLNLSGKIDRKALPEPQFEATTAFVKSRTTFEEALNLIVCRSLDHDEVGVHDNLFQLGADSLLAAKMAMDIQIELNRDTQVSDIFDYPTVSQLANYLSDREESSQQSRILASQTSDHLPLSYAQERLLFVHQLGDNSHLYHVHSLLKFDEGITRESVKAALQALCRRHTVLRSVYAADEQGVYTMQPVNDHQMVFGSTELDTVDEDHMFKAASEVIEASFDLEKEVPLRVQFYDRNDELYCLLVWHHIAIDGWSLAVVLKELAKLLERTSGVTADSLPKLDISYGDYAFWQRQRLQGSRLKTLSRFWENQLKGYETLRFPVDRLHPLQQLYQGDSFRVELPLAVSVGLRDLAHHQNSTLYTVMLSAFFFALSIFTRQDDLLVGTPSDDRQHGQTANMVGLFANMLVLRSITDHRSTVYEHIDSVRRTIADAMNYRDLPFEKLVELLEPARDTSRHPIFQVAFAVQHFNVAKPNWPFECIDNPRVQALNTTAKFDLTVMVDDSADCLAVDVNYATSILDRSTVDSFISLFQKVLLHFSTGENVCLSELDCGLARQPALDSSTARRGVQQRSSETTIVRLLDTVVAQYGLKPAIEEALVTGEARVTSYNQLAQQSDSLAHGIRVKLGMQGQLSVKTVALLMGRSTETVIAQLAILKLGLAYLPLDPSHPEARLSQLIEQTGCTLLLATSEHVSQAQGLSCGVDVVAIETLQKHQSDRSEWLNRPAHADQLAYIMYTSGSTGVPKGVMINQSSIINLAFNRHVVSLSESDQVLMTGAVAFDAITWEVWGSLLNGATLHIVPEQTLLHTRSLSAEIAQRNVTTLFMTTQLFNLHIEQQPDAFRGVQQIAVGGEAMSPRHTQLAMSSSPGLSVINVYGPTENTALSLCHRVKPTPVSADDCSPLKSSPSALTPIGRPFDNTSVYVVSKNGHRLPQGAIGELWLGGEGVGRGYFDRPALTAERFVPDPFCVRPGGRVYRTGDLGRCNKGGDVEFHGRIDTQVKIRGYRIELSEVERAIEQHSFVQQTVVTVVREGNNTQLACYIVSDATGEDTIANLRESLDAQLPEYMVPDRYKLIDHIPLTANGKTDYAALPQAQRYSGTSYKAPSTPLEQRLSELWQRVIGDERVGVNDSFFRLGGNSLMAVRLVTLMRQDLGVSVRLQDLLAKQTIANLIAHTDLTQQESETELANTTITTRSLSSYSLSFAQERMLFIDQFEGGGPAYHVPILIKLGDSASLRSLKTALSQLAERHSILRTVYPLNEEGERYQLVLQSADESLKVDEEAINDDTDWHRSVERQIRRPFELSHQASIRASLHRGRNERFLLLVIHHIAFDGWSQEIFAREFDALYRSAVGGRAVELPLLDISYIDYSAWQRDMLQGDRLRTLSSYWLKALEGFEELSLPTDFSRPDQLDFSGRTLDLTLSDELTNRLLETSKEQEVSLFTMFLTALKLSLAVQSGQRDILVGVPSDNRHHIQTQGLIGLFVNSVVVRSDVDFSTSFSDMIKCVNQSLVGAQLHQELPFEQLVNMLNVPRDRSRNPIFQVMVNQEDEHYSLAQSGNVDYEFVAIQEVTPAKFDLSVSVRVDTAATISFTYATALFKEHSIQRLMSLTHTFLEHAANDPTAPISDTSWVTERERNTLVYAVNKTDRETASQLSLIDQFRHQVDLRSDSIALSGYYESSIPEYLSYSCLDSSVATLSQRIDHAFHQLNGTRTESVAAIYLEKSFEFVIGVLATLRAGGAWLPLSPGHPAARLKTIVNDALPTLLVSSRDLLNEAHDPLAELFTASQCVFVNEHWSTVPPNEPLSPRHINDSELAYILYTSGSSGSPKGVMIEHPSLVNYLAHQSRMLGIDDTDIILWLADPVFDASIEQLFLGLTHGAHVVVPSKRDILEPAVLGRKIISHAVSHLHATPTYLNALGEINIGHQLRRVVSGGEPCNHALRERWGSLLINKYGPTETTISVLECFDYSQQDSANTIGLPVDNCSVYVLSAERQLVPAGVPGELCVGGAALARGYVNNDVLNASRFIDNPFATPQQRERGYGRLYCTGDRVRWILDTQGEPTALEFLGRLDQQVKLRGFRIELGEIESVLRQQQRVKDVAVRIVDCDDGDHQLVAWVSLMEPSIDWSQAVADLRSHCVAVLPDYMHPSTYVCVEEIPRTQSGKLNYRALPEPSETDALSDYAAPEGDTERQLADIWSIVLGGVEIGREDNFFAKGGHSLLATRLVSRVQRTLSDEFSIVHVFTHRTLTLQAKLIDSFKSERGSEESMKHPEPIIERIPRDQPLPLSHAQQRMWFLSQYMGATSAYNIAYAWRLGDDTALDYVCRACEQIIERHEALRTTFAQNKGTPVQIINVEPVAVAVEWVDRQSDVDKIRDDERHYNFDLNKDPLCRIRLVAVASDSSPFESATLIFTIHHGVFDGWSTEVLVNDLSRLYDLLLQGSSESLEPLTIQYVDYAVWQRQRMSGAHLKSHYTWWKDYLEEVPEIHSLATDFPRPAEQSNNGGFENIEFPVELIDSFRLLCRTHDVTLYMGMLAVFSVLLTRYSDQTDIPIGTPVANRLQTEAEPVIGLFVNTLVMRCRLEGNPSFVDYLNTTRQMALDVYEHQELPFELLIEKLNPTRHLSASPIFQIMFSLQSRATDTHKSRLTLESLDTNTRDNAVTHFDLSLLLDESPKGNLEGVIEFNRDLFDRQTIVRMKAHLMTLLQSIVLKPQDRLSELTMLCPGERAESLRLAQTACRAETPFTSVCQKFETHVDVSCDSIAVVRDSEEGVPECVSYGLLDEYAQTVASNLRDMNIGTEEFVGVFVDYSVSSLAALLGIMKAGAVYAPLDPELPEQRLRWIADELNISLFVHSDAVKQAQAIKKFKTASDTALDRKIVNIDSLRADSSIRDQRHPDRLEGVRADHAAYVIYTSGSTGKPKGTVVEQGALGHHIEAMIDRYHCGQNDISLLFNSLSFDASLEQVFCALCSGSQLVLRPDELWDATELSMWLVKHQVTAIDIVPAYAVDVLPAVFSDALFLSSSPLSRIVVGGEAFPLQLVRSWEEQGLQDRCRLFNAYGPTETCITSHLYRVPVSAQEYSTMPLGEAVGNSSTYILDPYQNLVPHGVSGELCIGGARLARSYFDHAGLTAQNFIPNPFGSDPGERLYRTGDKVRRLPNGLLEYVGRADQQVKIRGFRIELAEIEQVLLQSNDVKEVKVQVRSGETIGDRLVAWIVREASDVSLASDEKGSVIDLVRSHARERLPGYMLPNAYVLIEAMPLTSSGKVNAKALPTPSMTDYSKYIAPQSVVEKSLVSIWSDLLNVNSPIGANANFFDLGGHSLLATRMISSLNVAHGVRIALKDIFAVQTLGGIADIVEDQLALGQLDSEQRVEAFHDDDEYDMDEFEL